MKLKLVPFVGLLLGGVTLAQRRANTSICDYYTTALLKDNSATNQLALLVLVVNTAVIGNYSNVNVGVKVPGVLSPGMYNGTRVNLLPYFNGGLASTNNGGSAGVVQNFLDGGGAAPLMGNMAANGMNSNQYTLMTHLYEFFGQLLGCSKIGTAGFSAYTGDKSMYEVHKYMALDAFQVGYFITQVGLSAASFGVAIADVEAVSMALQSLFGYRCAAPATVVPSQGPQLQAVCIADNCPTALNESCSPYAPVMQPLAANASMYANVTTSVTMTISSRPSQTSTQSVRTSTGIAAHFSPAAALVGAAALAFAL